MGASEHLILRRLDEKELTLLEQKLDAWDLQVVRTGEEIWALGDFLALVKVNTVLDLGVEIGWRSFDEGKGYATEAVRQYCEMNQGITACAIIGVHNKASQRVAEKNNFEIYYHTPEDLYYRKTL